MVETYACSTTAFQASWTLVPQIFHTSDRAPQSDCSYFLTHSTQLLQQKLYKHNMKPQKLRSPPRMQPTFTTHHSQLSNVAQNLLQTYFATTKQRIYIHELCYNTTKDIHTQTMLQQRRGYTYSKRPQTQQH